MESGGSSGPTSPNHPAEIPSIEAVRTACYAVFKVWPCSFQVEFARAILRRSADVILEVGTGMGKTLAFWLPILFRPHGIQVVITALNALGQQCVWQLTRYGISAVSIDGNLTSVQMTQAFKGIEDGMYRAVIISPEQIMKEDGHFQRLLLRRTFLDNLIACVIDEGHSIYSWGKFRPEYRDLERLRYRLLKDMPFAIVSATLPALVRKDVCNILRFRSDNLVYIRRSADRPNIVIAVRKILHPLDSFLDLGCLFPKDRSGPPPAFLIFFPSIAKAMAATKVLWSMIGMDQKPEEKVVWYHSGMSEEYKKDTLEALEAGRLWGLCTTDAFGMGIDLQNIELVINYEVKCEFSLLWQRFGRAARDRNRVGVAILYAEASRFDEEREEQLRKKAEKAESKKRKRGQTGGAGKVVKRQAGSSNSSGVTVAISTVIDDDGESVASDAEETQMNVENRADVGTAVHPPSGTASVDLEARRRQYAEAPAKEKRRAKQEEEPVMADFVNAGTRAFNCRRTPGRIYFDYEDSPSHHLECNASSPSGCQRCAVIPLELCCDLHRPGKEYIDSLYPPVPYQKPPRATAKSSFRKHAAGDMAKVLRNALHRWRVEKTAEEYGEGFVEDVGPCIVMPNETLECIVDCAFHKKIVTTDDLQRETSWDSVTEYGNEIIAIVQQAYPPPPPPSTAPPVLSNLTNANVVESQTAAPAGARKAQKPLEEKRCGGCHVLGHTRRSMECPLYAARKAERAQAAPKKKKPAATSQAAPSLTPASAPPSIPAMSTSVAVPSTASTPANRPLLVNPSAHPSAPLLVPYLPTTHASQVASARAASTVPAASATPATVDAPLPAISSRPRDVFDSLFASPDYRQQPARVLDPSIIAAAIRDLEAGGTPQRPWISTVTSSNTTSSRGESSSASSPPLCNNRAP